MNLHIIELDGKEPSIKSYRSQAALAAGVAAAGSNHRAIKQQADLAVFSTPELVRIINKLRAGQKPIKAFHTKADAVERVWLVMTGAADAALDDEETAAPIPDADGNNGPADAAPKPDEENMATKIKTKKEKTPKVKPPKEKKERAKLPTGEGSPVRRESSLGKILALLIEGGHSLEEIAKKSGVKSGAIDAVGKVRHRIHHVLRVGHGIEPNVNGAGNYSVSLPDGFNKNTIFKDAK